MLNLLWVDLVSKHWGDQDSRIVILERDGKRLTIDCGDDDALDFDDDALGDGEQRQKALVELWQQWYKAATGGDEHAVLSEAQGPDVKVKTLEPGEQTDMGSTVNVYLTRGDRQMCIRSVLIWETDATQEELRLIWDEHEEMEAAEITLVNERDASNWE